MVHGHQVSSSFLFSYWALCMQATGTLSEQLVQQVVGSEQPAAVVLQYV